MITLVFMVKENASGGFDFETATDGVEHSTAVEEAAAGAVVHVINHTITEIGLAGGKRATLDLAATTEKIRPLVARIVEQWRLAGKL